VLQTGANLCQRIGLAPPNGHDEPVTDEDHHVTGLDIRGRLDVAQRLQRQEDRVVVDIELGSLVALDCVLNRQRRELELLVHQGELGVSGILQADPDEPLPDAA